MWTAIDWNLGGGTLELVGVVTCMKRWVVGNGHWMGIGRREEGKGIFEYFGIEQSFVWIISIL